MELDYISGSCLLCKKEVINTIGLLDSNFYMYWEDVNWCLNGLKYGYKSVYSYKSKICINTVHQARVILNILP